MLTASPCSLFLSHTGDGKDPTGPDLCVVQMALLPLLSGKIWAGALV